MPIITISRGSYSHGREVAEKLAGKLGYDCVSREIILSASKLFNIPEMTLVRAVRDAPTVIDRFTSGKQKYVAYVRHALLDRLQKDNAVYHGLAGHYFLRGVPHVLKVRILADMDDRVAEERRREGLTAEEALKALSRDDEARCRWSHYFFGIDTADPSLYDIIVHIRSLSVDEAVDIIAQAAALPCFRPTPQSRKQMRLLYLAARLQTSLMDLIPSISVRVESGTIVVVARGHWAEGRELLARIDRLIDAEKEQAKIKVKLTNR